MAKNTDEGKLARLLYDRAEAAKVLPNFFYIVRIVQSSDNFPGSFVPRYEIKEFSTREELTKYIEENGMPSGNMSQCFTAKRLETKLEVTLSE